MIFIRSLVFQIIFYAGLIVFLIFGLPFLFTTRKAAIAALKVWSRSFLWMLKTIARIDLEIIGKEHIPHDACLLVGKHQSLWETFALFSMLDDPAIVLKRELMFIPVLGWFAIKFEMIPVDRGAGVKALKKLIASAQKAVAQNRQIIIFPEGTRKEPGAKPDYKPGAAALYLRLSVPAVPFGLNSGELWPRRSFLKYPGTIRVKFSAPIPPGLTRREFSRRMQHDIETATREVSGQ